MKFIFQISLNVKNQVKIWGRLCVLGAVEETDAKKGI